MKTATAKVNPDYTLTRPKRLRKFEKVDGVKVVSAAWQEPEKKERPKLIRATTAKGRRIAIREMQRRAAK